MFAHAAKLAKLLEDRGENPDLIVQILNDSRFVQPSSIEAYCRRLDKNYAFRRNDCGALARSFVDFSHSSIFHGSLERPLITILTRNSSSWIAKQARYFSENCFDAIFYVDAQSDDMTEEVLAGVGAKYKLHDSVGGTLESGMHKIISDNPDRWILRLDDDEIISPLTYEGICISLKSGLLNTDHCYSLPRKWLFLHSTLPRIYVSRYQIFLDLDYQPRLFFSGSVEHTSKLHTPGFTLTSGIAPIRLDRYYEILHFDAVVHSLSNRLMKLIKYDNISPGNFTRFKSFYLPETIPFQYHCSIPFEHYACDPVVLSYGFSLCSTVRH